MTKVLVASLQKKKARAILLIVSIAFCGALIFCNEGFSQTMGAMIYEADSRWGGQSNLCVSTWDKPQTEPNIDSEDFALWQNEFEYLYLFTQIQAFYQPAQGDPHCFTALGVDMPKFMNHNSFELAEGKLLSSTGFEVIIGETYAQKYSIKTGDVIPLEIGGKLTNFTIAGVARPEGVFLRELADGGYLLVPQETLVNLLGTSSNLAFIKLKDASKVDDFRLDMAEALPQYKVDFAFNPTLVTAEINNYLIPFQAGSVSVLFMCTFIIYTSFNLITQERISLLGILRSLGCSRKKANCILLMESVGIGFVGGVLGCLLGFVLLLVIKDVYFGAGSLTPNVTLHLNFGAIAKTIVFSVAATISISLIPILRLTSQPVKDLILNDFHQKKVKLDRSWVMGLVLCVIAFTTYFFLVPNKIGMLFAFGLVILSIVGMLLLLPRLGQWLCFILQGAPIPVQMAARNLVEFKSIMNNTRLVASVIAIMFLLLSLFGTLTEDLHASYDKLGYDIQLSLRQANKESLTKLTNLNTVKDSLGIQETDLALLSQNTFFNALYGIENEDLFKYFGIELDAPTRTALANLGAGRNIVTTHLLRLKFDLKIGDTLVFEYGGRQFSYIITGFLDTNYGIGHVGYVSRNNFMQDTGITNYTSFYVQSNGDVLATQQAIRNEFSKDILRIDTLEELRLANADKVEGILSSISLYTLLAIFVGVLGIGNNIAASFISRQRLFAIYRTLGTSLKHTQALLFFETFWTLALGIGAGGITGLFLIQLIPFLVSMAWGRVNVTLPLAQLALLALLTIASMFLAALVPYGKMKRFSVMQNIRQE